MKLENLRHYQRAVEKIADAYPVTNDPRYNYNVILWDIVKAVVDFLDFEVIADLYNEHGGNLNGGRILPTSTLYDANGAFDISKLQGLKVEEFDPLQPCYYIDGQRITTNIYKYVDYLELAYYITDELQKNFELCKA